MWCASEASAGMVASCAGRRCRFSCRFAPAVLRSSLRLTLIHTLTVDWMEVRVSSEERRVEASKMLTSRGVSEGEEGSRDGAEEERRERISGWGERFTVGTFADRLR